MNPASLELLTAYLKVCPVLEVAAREAAEVETIHWEPLPPTAPTRQNRYAPHW
jgi:hypothetical protein